MTPKPINLTSKSASEWILLIKLYETKANFTNSCQVLSGLQGNSSQVCEFKKTVKLFNISLKVSIQMYFLMLN